MRATHELWLLRLTFVLLFVLTCLSAYGAYRDIERRYGRFDQSQTIEFKYVCRCAEGGQGLLLETNGDFIAADNGLKCTLEDCDKLIRWVTDGR